MSNELRITKYKFQLIRIFCVLSLVVGFSLSTRAQSTNQNFPTAISSNEIGGSIKARDLGDARLTSYFYVFNATQGDVFINVVSNNLNGNIDVFIADGLRPLTKIIVFADVADTETGRVIYLRKPEKLILRVEGRTPNDDPATFKIKFAGSFQPLAEAEKTEAPDDPKVASNADSDVRVNSVGTIISIKPKSTPQPIETGAENREKGKSAVKESPTADSAKDDAKNVVQQISVETGTDKAVIAETNAADKNERNIEVAEKENKIEIAVTENEQAKIESASEKSETADSTDSGKNANETTPEKTAKTPVKKNTTAPRNSAREARNAKAAELNAALENIRLIVLMKDGSKIERPMSEILRVGVDKGVLTVIAKDGKISRYSILDVEKMTIE